jgi:hypothetical protein
MDIHVSDPRTNRRKQFVKFSGRNSALIRQVRNVRCRYRSGDRCRWCGTRLSAGGTISKVGAKEHADWTSDALLTKVYVGLLNSAFQIGVTKLPVNSRVVVADASVKGSISGS